MQKKLIIFGAGASVGAGDSCIYFNHEKKRELPALGTNLFSTLQNFDPSGWGNLSESLAEVFKEDFEHGMKVLSQKLPHLVDVLQRKMALYFFRFTPGKQNLYFRLAQLIKQTEWDGALVTLNYELLLIKSLNWAGLNPIEGCSNGNLKQNEIEICFPHGCCNIFNDAIRANNYVSSGNNISTYSGGNLSAIFDRKQYLERINSDAFPPIMSYFEPKKQTKSGVDFINENRFRFQQLVGEADTIVIIGLRLRESDGHIWNPLAKSSAKLIYCSGKTAGREFDTWHERYRSPKKDITINSYFKESFDRICDYLGIF